MNETGKNTGPVAALAEIYPQLYLTPGDEGALAYGPIVRRGQDARPKQGASRPMKWRCGWKRSTPSGRNSGTAGNDCAGKHRHALSE